MDRVFTIARALDYRGGELRMNTNLSLDSLVCELVELTTYTGVDYYDELYEMTHEEITEVINATSVQSDSYAGGEGTVFEVYEHKDNKLTELTNLNQFKPAMLKCIIEDL